MQNHLEITLTLQSCISTGNAQAADIVLNKSLLKELLLFSVMST